MKQFAIDVAFALLALAILPGYIIAVQRRSARMARQISQQGQ